MNPISFSLSYSALKLFGKQLYSNVGSAISELVANGLDANAENVYISINKPNKTVEVYDDGDGMSESDILNHYSKIGYNKRNDQPSTKKGATMGRKGIGKLAALFLSDRYFVITKKEDGAPICMELNVSGMADDATPQLLPYTLSDDIIEKIENYSSLLTRGKGTIIHLTEVDFDRIGDNLFESIKQRISSVFLYSEMAQKVFLKIAKTDKDTPQYNEIDRKIAFKNLSFIYASDESRISECIDNNFRIPSHDKNNNSLPSVFKTEVGLFEKNKFNAEGSITIMGRSVSYQLVGWVGIHSTINPTEAKVNDERFIKNTMYSPNQLRLYVRKKLAVPNMLDYLHLTAAFANYLEGEILFDILDDDDLPDIATAGRQDFDSTDPRFVRLVEILRNICTSLIHKRQKLADLIKNEEKKANDSINTKAKRIFNTQFKKKLDSYPEVPEKVKESLQTFTSAQIKGDTGIELKTEYSLFISHSSSDRLFTDFLYNYLLHIGVDKDEVFYTSGQPDTSREESLSSRIKSWIIEKNNDILFVVSGNFNASQYCLFEGGAAWATRSEQEYKIISLDTYEAVPSYLTNGKKEAILNLSITDWDLNRDRYSYLREVILRIVNHLNKNRIIANKPLIELKLAEVLPDEVDLTKEGKILRDYIDGDLCLYWDTYVKKYIERLSEENENNEADQ